MHFKTFILLLLMSCPAILQAASGDKHNTGLIYAVHQETFGRVGNAIWDGLRSYIVADVLRNAYTNIYYVQGRQLEDDAFMQETWKKAVSENDQIDYVTFVHGGRQFIKPEWIKATELKGKLRMVYSEACEGGSGQWALKKFGAVATAGHNPATGSMSASPFFSMFFLSNWAKGLSFRDSLKEAFQSGKWYLTSRAGFYIAQKIAGYKSPGEALAQSAFHFAHWSEYPAAEISIHSDLSKMRNYRGSIKEDSISHM